MTVTIKVVTRQKAGEVCAANAELVPIQVTLARPLDGRKVIDGTTGRAVPVPVATSSTSPSR
ncbi:hypothetical protein ACIBW9_35250 [Streptomyces sp. NPDC049541]|uniref:hypothetical protein n=1 Tax=Streptomyces sp. NPDC049541 TaxID=3365594 RepID=UPI0037ABF49B